jgi:hypothetical protein
MHAAILIPLSRQNTSPINSQRFGSIHVGSRLHDEKVIGIPANNNKAGKDVYLNFPLAKDLPPLKLGSEGKTTSASFFVL